MTRAREHAADDRRGVSDERDETGHGRVGDASDRDLAAELRDLGADDRDVAARARDREDDQDGSRDDILTRAKRDRERASDDRTRAADDRAQAAADRKAASRDRSESQRVRSESTDLLNAAANDQLTGARSHYLGLAEAARELDRARRTGSSLTLAFIDVEPLLQRNDAHGLVAGDELRRLVADALRANLRQQDVIVRYADNEFVCAMPNVAAPAARACFARINRALVGFDPAHSIRYGLAQAADDETLETLIARAHADL
jgi:diguanylate cyclase (GGDEF)-like protein